MDGLEIPLFPLRTVLFPDGLLPLRIFEQRYLTMVRDCVRNDCGFGVCLIVEGEEAMTPVRIAPFGTMAHIVDWFTLEDGLLGVSSIGTTRFRVESTRRQADGLMWGTVVGVPEPYPQTLPEPYAVLALVLSRFLDKLGQHYANYTPAQLDDAAWVGYRLSEFLPLPAIEKQNLLEKTDPIDRLQDLLEILPRFQSD